MPTLLGFHFTHILKKFWLRVGVNQVPSQSESTRVMSSSSGLIRRIGYQNQTYILPISRSRLRRGDS